jgi:hypothetical protein
LSLPKQTVVLKNVTRVRLKVKDISQISTTVAVKVKKDYNFWHQSVNIARLMQDNPHLLMSETFVENTFDEAWTYGSSIFSVKEAIE